MRRCARADVGEVLAHSHFSEKNWTIKNVIARRATAISPFSLDIVGDVVGADLLGMAIDAAVCCVNVLALFEHSRLRTWINVRPLFVRFRIEMSDLPRRDDREANPRKRERAEDSEKERSKPFHARLNSAVCPDVSGLGSRKRGASRFINGLRLSRLRPG